MADIKNKTVVIVSAKQSVVIRGIVKKLEEHRYRTMLMGEEPAKIGRMIPTASVFLLYLHETLGEDMMEIMTLREICDALRDGGCKVILVGEEKDHDVILKEIPSAFNFTWMPRPVELNELVVTMHEILNGTSQPPQKKKHILIVDDDEAYARMILEWLRYDFDVSIVTDGMQTIGFLTANDVDLVLLDYEMPVMDGARVLEMIRYESAWDRIPVVFLTGIGNRESVSKAVALKPDGYILKTTTRDELIRTVREKASAND